MGGGLYVGGIGQNVNVNVSGTYAFLDDITRKKWRLIKTVKNMGYVFDIGMGRYTGFITSMTMGTLKIT